MWPLVREGLRFYGAGLLTAWVGHVVGGALTFLFLALFGVVDLRQALVWCAQAAPIVLLSVAAVFGWIAFGSEASEHRLRLHATLPVSLGRLALAQLLLPASFVVLGVLAGHAAAALVAALDLAPAPWFPHARLDLVAAHALLLLMLTLAGREVVVRREEGWGRLAAAALGVVAIVALEVLALGAPAGGPALRTAAAAALAVVTAAYTIALFRRRRQFLR